LQDTLKVTEEEFERVFEVNVKSIFHSVRAVVPIMKEQGGGSIINISSIGSVRPRPGELHPPRHSCQQKQALSGTTAPRAP
jgi:NAD(P)-dependent dehydrogenase (short-subunit alcohol dehydrogenase family)